MIKKIFLPVILTCIIGLTIYFIPPKNIFIIFGLVFLIAFTVYLLISLFFNRKNGLLFSIFIFLFLLINYLIGFDYLSLGLLTSLLISIKLLIK